MALRVGKVMQNMAPPAGPLLATIDRKSTRLNSSHLGISYAVFCLKKKNNSLISNLAAPVGTPSLVIFGPTYPAVWAQHFSPGLSPLESREPAEFIAVREHVSSVPP